MDETFVPFRGIENYLKGRLLFYKQDLIGGLRAGISPITSVYVSATLLRLTLVGRAAFVFPLSFLSNLAKKSPNENIDFKQQVTIWWAGLMRGVVSVALAYNQIKFQFYLLDWERESLLEQVTLSCKGRLS